MKSKSGNNELMTKLIFLGQAEDIRVCIVSRKYSTLNKTLFLVNYLMIKFTMVHALVHNGCLCSDIINEALVVELGLLREPIYPCVIQIAEESTAYKPIIAYKKIYFLTLMSKSPQSFGCT